MKINRDVLITAIIKHQAVFFRMLDWIDEQDGALEVPEHLYLNNYNQIICQDKDVVMQHQLSIETLVDNGVFIHHDKSAGVISIERVIVDLLRFLDIKRAKELTNADFEQMRVQLVGAVDHVMAQEIDTQEYIDGMRTFNNLMSEIHSKVKENVHALTKQVDDLAIEYKQYDAGSKEVSVFDLYDKVTSLYSRFVLPCYEFINPSMEMVKTESFSKSVQSLFEYHAFDADRQDVSVKINLRKTAITSYYKDISLLTKKLEQFSGHLEKDRRSFLAIESAYSELINSVIPLRHGRRNNASLTAKSEVFFKYHSLDGLTSQKNKFAKKFMWNSDKTKLHFKEYLNLIKEKHIKRKAVNLKPLKAPKKQDEDRQILISKILYSNGGLESTPNVHQFLFDLLSESLDDFGLIDVLYGVEDILSAYADVKRTDNVIRHHMDDGKYFMKYVQIEYKKEAAHV